MFRMFFGKNFVSFVVGFFFFSAAVLRQMGRNIFSFFHILRLGMHGKKCRFGLKCMIFYPSNISIKDHVIFEDGCILSSEFDDSFLTIDEDTSINKDAKIDFSGGCSIGSHCTISEGSVLLSHSHGLNPNNQPQKTPLKIGNNVWIGMHSIILPQAKEIGEGAIIGAGAVVTKPVPAHAIAAGNPAVVIRKIDNLQYSKITEMQK